MLFSETAGCGYVFCYVSWFKKKRWGELAIWNAWLELLKTGLKNKKSIFVERNQYWKGNNDYLDVFKILKGEEQGLAVT